jgi:hypothetical protein
MERAIELDPSNTRIQEKVIELDEIVRNLPEPKTPEPTVEIIEV